MTTDGKQNAPSHSYDRVAHLYDLDMARNMAFDDIGCYVDIARGSAGRALEIGCGNGRILRPLLESGADAFGIDYSAAMLAQLCAKDRAGSACGRVARMDARSLAFGCDFALVLCAYSLATYMTSVDDMRALVSETLRVLRPGGRLVVDAFIPRARAQTIDFRLDYRRRYAAGELARSKRVTEVRAGINRIERHYEVRDNDGVLIDEVDTVEEIRPLAPDALMAAWARPDVSLDATLWDYREQDRPAAAQFCTLILRKKR